MKQTSVEIVLANMFCITSNDRLFGCPITHTDTIHNSNASKGYSLFVLFKLCGLNYQIIFIRNLSDQTKIEFVYYCLTCVISVERMC